MEVVSALRLFGPMVLAAVRGGLLDAKSQCIFCMSGDLCVRVVYAECGALDTSSGASVDLSLVASV